MGGSGNAASGNGDMLSDLWKYSPTTGQWTWVSGDSVINKSGVYGTKGVASASNKPGARSSSISWSDASGNLWLMGGYGYAANITGAGHLNDLWKYNTTTGQWTWMSGDNINTINNYGVYGTRGVASVSNKPGQRSSSMSWSDANGNLWLMGGYGHAANAIGFLNDLWKYSPTTGKWTWVSGDNTINQSGIYGIKGVNSASNKPGGRENSNSWSDASGNLWLMGGYGYDENGEIGNLNDLWKYNTTTGQWSWMSGDNAVGQFGVYGTIGVGSSNNKPGVRKSSFSWLGANGNLWLMGGEGVTASDGGFLNDMWQFGCIPSKNTITQTACGSYLWHGTTYTTSGTYTFDSLNAGGCDSVTTLKLTINQPTTSTTTISNCVSYTWNGTTYYASGSYTIHLTNAAGCDSAATLNLTIKQPTTSTTFISNCVSYTWNGTTYYASGSYTIHLTNAAGCDSATTLNLTIKQPTTSTTTISHCGSYTWHGTTYITSGTYTFDSLNAGGCDSLTTLHLTINQPTTSSTTKNATGSFAWHGTTYTTSGSYTFDTTNAAGCDSLTTLNLTISNVITWTGAVSSDWNNPANWNNNAVPTSSSTIIIPVTVNKPISTGNQFVKDITIYSGETLYINGTLNVSGNWTNNGTFTSSNSGKVILAGTGTISGNTTFSNLEVQGNYSVGATASDKISVTGILNKTSGTLNTSDKLTLISNAVGSALIQENGGSLTGKAYIQHYTSGSNGYHHFSSPVSGATVSSWSNSFPITGANGASSWVASKVGTLQWYDEIDNTTSLLDSSYYNYTSLSGALTPGKGFTAWLNSLPTLNTFGTPNNGTITIPVTHTTGSNAPRGWNFVGNPYPSPISWTSLKSLNPGLFGDASCYLWKSSGGKNGVWQAFDGTVGANGAGDIINSSLGFFVYVNASGTLTFNNSVRSYSYLCPEIFGTATSSNQIRVSVNDATSGETDEAVAYTSNAASISRKMLQPLEAKNPTIAFEVKGTKAAIDVIKTVDANTVLPLTINTPKAGSYSLKFTAINTSLPVYLKDAVNGTYTDVKANGEVFITTTATETANRYSLVFTSPIAEIASAYNVFAKANNIVVTNPATTGATIVVYNTLGQQVAKAIATSTTTTIPVSSTSAHYVVKILDNKGANVVKQVIIR